MNAPTTFPAPTVADELADLLLSGASAMTLHAQLQQRFSRASRFDVFWGVAMAISLFEADRVGLLHDLACAEAKLAALEAGGADGG